MWVSFLLVYFGKLKFYCNVGFWRGLVNVLLLLLCVGRLILFGISVGNCIFHFEINLFGNGRSIKNPITMKFVAWYFVKCVDCSAICLNFLSKVQTVGAINRSFHKKVINSSIYFFIVFLNTKFKSHAFEIFALFLCLFFNVMEIDDCPAKLNKKTNLWFFFIISNLH